MNQYSETLRILEDVREEHKQLRELLANFNRVIADENASVARMAELLAALTAHLQTQFRDKEKVGIYDRLVELFPALALQTAQIREAHEEFVRRADQMKALLANGEVGDDWRQSLNAKFQSFSDSLVQHAANEEDLLTWATRHQESAHK